MNFVYFMRIAAHFQTIQFPQSKTECVLPSMLFPPPTRPVPPPSFTFLSEEPLKQNMPLTSMGYSDISSHESEISMPHLHPLSQN